MNCCAVWAAVLTLVVAAAAQNAHVPVTPFQRGPCNGGAFFDTALLECTPCPQGTVPSADQRSCVGCDSSSGSLFLFRNGFALTQEWNPASRIGGSCSCVNSSSNSSSIVALVERNGAVLERCVVCPSGSAPNPENTACVPTGGSLNNTSPQGDLEFVLSRLGLSNINIGAATEATFPSISVPNSVPLNVLLGPSARACLEEQSRRACNAVANLCALQLYKGKTAACKLYRALVSQLAGGSSSQGPRPATGPLPWLFYSGNDYAHAHVNLTVHFGSGGADTIASGEPVSQFTFILSAYALNGTWLGFYEWIRDFQLCGIHSVEGGLWRNFGWEYNNSCDIELPFILEELPPSREPVFYDAFLRTATDTLYPVPVKVTNSGSGAVRRFFYMDGALGTSQGSSRTNADFRVVQFPSVFRLKITQRPNPTNEIFPPQIFITYDFRQVPPGAGQSTDSIHIQYAVDYLNGRHLKNSFDRGFNIMLIVFLVALAFPTITWKVFVAFRRQKDSSGLLGFFFFVAMCALDVASFALFLVVGLVALYQLILYKLEVAVFFIVPKNQDLENFRATAIVAACGQAVSLLYMLGRQVSADLFFLDWEKPRKVLSHDGTRIENAEVSSWRLLFIVNRFAELQTVRITSPEFTLFMMVLILVGANVQTAGDVVPKEHFGSTYRTTQPSIVLRWGIQTAFFLVLFLGEYGFRKLLYFPYVSNPITNFVDLMYLANISAIFFEDRHVGSYIHGRNHAQHADTTVRGLDSELEKEVEGLVAPRGLIPTYQGSRDKCENQVFQFYTTAAVRKQYDSKMKQKLAQVQRQAKLRQGQVLTLLKGTGKPEEAMLAANDDVAAFFREVVTDVERNYSMQVVDPSFPQLFFMLPPAASALNTIFVHDYFRSFTETIFFGNEMRLYVFEALFFMSVDLALNNVAATALITYAMVRAVALVRKALGAVNISQKTSIDLHFLS